MKAKQICEPCLKEFQIKNCGFDHMPPEELVRSQWQSRTKNIFYLFYRWAVAIFFIGVVSDSMSADNGILLDYYFIYLTNWGVWTCMLTGVYGAVLVTIWYCHPVYSDKINQTNTTPIWFKFYWSMHNATMTLAFVITIIYWVILHRDTTPMTATNVLTHACNSAIMFLDVLIVAHPIRLFHVIQPLIIGLTYLIFSIIYYAAGGTDRAGNRFIYFVLDWSKPGAAIVTAVLTVCLAFIVHIILFLVFKLRVLIHDKCAKKKMVLPTATPQSPGSQISMVLGSGYNNAGFKGSTNDII